MLSKISGIVSKPRSLIQTRVLSHGGRFLRRSNSTACRYKRALLMDANGVIYKRNEKKLAAVTRYLIETGRYDHAQISVEGIQLVADTLHELQEEANRGVITAEQYFMTLLSSLPISPVDYTGTLDAIKRSQFNISLFPDVQSTLATLKQVHGVRLGVVTDSMSTTAEKMAWMQHAGLDTSLFDVVINSCEVGVTKPDHQMYERALNALGVRADEAAFLGHRGSELDGAQAVGCSTLVMFPDRDLLAQGGVPMARFDFFVPSWKDVLHVPMWASQAEKQL